MGTKTPRRSGAGASKEKLVLNKQELNSIKQIAYEYPDVEFLYLRENDFDAFDPYIRLIDLKMLDLSLNNIKSVAFLWGGALPTTTGGELALPRLRHLFLTGNCIDSMQGLSYLNSLETLALSNNCISSFEGLGSLPNLKVLSLNFNEISTFKHFPFLPSLSSLGLQGNPVSKCEAYRAMAASVCCAYLNKIDGRKITDGEMDLADRMQGKVAFCVTEGFIPTSLDDELVKTEADAFLLELQRQQSIGKSLNLQSITLGRSEDSPYKGTTPIEGIPVVLRVCLKVTGDASEVLVTGSMNDWDNPIPLERVVTGNDVCFQTYLYLPPGKHEYRYLVDGMEKVSEDRKTTSKYGKGTCNYYPVSDIEVPDDQEDRDTILHIRWLRSNDYNGFDLLPEQNGLSYTPGEEDVGRCMRCEVLAYEEGNFTSIVFDISQPVQPGFPTCQSLVINGDCVEGQPLMADYEYTGGSEHTQLNIKWIRNALDGDLDVTDFAEPNSLAYYPTTDDVGCTLTVSYTPMRSDWTAGNPVSATSKVIRAAPPK